MENKNIFYAIRGQVFPDNAHQLDNLGEQRPFITIGRNKSRYDWDSSEPSSQTFYTKTTSEDYDKAFAYRLVKIKPPYQIDSFLNYHFDYAIQNGNQKEVFLKHMKYVTLPLVAKKADAGTYVTLLTEWIDNKMVNRA